MCCGDLDQVSYPSSKHLLSTVQRLTWVEYCSHQAGTRLFWLENKSLITQMVVPNTFNLLVLRLLMSVVFCQLWIQSFICSLKVSQYSSSSSIIFVFSWSQQKLKQANLMTAKNYQIQAQRDQHKNLMQIFIYPSLKEPETFCMTVSINHHPASR